MRQSLVVLVFAMLLAPGSVQSQTILNEYAAQPDTWRPAQISAPGVDAKGDLNLSIPVMTIPGRNGLDFDVVFGYTSGIKVRQQASWIGLGWSFDPGSIARDVQTMVAGGPFTTDDGMLASQQPDLYYVTKPGESFTMVRHDPLAIPGNQLPSRLSPTEFYPLNNKPVRVEYDWVDSVKIGIYWTKELVLKPPTALSTSKGDYESFVVTDPDGKRYVFANPLIQSNEGRKRIGSATYKKQRYYISSWRLIAILGRDYTGPIPSHPSQISKTADGSWIKFYYQTRTATRDAELSVPYVKQIAYVSAIETPTHKATFSASNRVSTDNSDGAWTPGANLFYQQLDSISLVAKYDGVDRGLVKRVILEHGALGGFPVSSTRLTLKELYQKDDDNRMLAGHRFEYYPIEGGTTIYSPSRDYMDDFGYFNRKNQQFSTDKDDAKSWSLKEITYPTGLKQEFIYENDQICLTCEAGGQQQRKYDLISFESDGGVTSSTGTYQVSSDRSWQGGVRVKEIITKKANVPNQSTIYEYGGGILTGVPSLFLERAYVQVANSHYFIPNDRGTVAVYYPELTTWNPTGTSTKTHYTHFYRTNNAPTADCRDDICLSKTAVTTVLGQQNYYSVATSNRSGNWGIPLWTYSDASGFRQTVIERNVSQIPVANAYVYGNVAIRKYATNNLVMEKVTSRSNAAVFDSTNTGLVSESLEYAYLDDSQLPYWIRRKTGDTTSVTLIEYGYETVYDSLDNENALSLPVKTDIVKEFVTPGGSYDSLFTNSTVTTYKEFDNGYFGPFKSMYWSHHTDSQSSPTFSCWHDTSISMSCSNSWVATGRIDQYGDDGGAEVLADGNNIKTEISRIHNSSLPSKIKRYGGSPKGALEAFHSEALDFRWTQVDRNSDGDTEWEIVNGSLRQTNHASATNNERDYIVYDLGQTINDEAIIEFDLTIADSDNWDFTIGVGGSSWNGDLLSTQNVTFSSINNEDWKFKPKSWQWSSVADDLVIGRTYRIKIVANVIDATVSYYLDGVLRVDGAPFLQPSSGVRKISFGNYGYSHNTVHWVIDNVRIVNPDLQIGQIVYNDDTLYPEVFFGELGTVSHHEYDSFGRLISTSNQMGDILASNGYSLSRTTQTDDYDPLSPNAIIATAYTNAEFQSNFSTGAGFVNTLGPDFSFGETGPDDVLSLKAEANSSDRRIVRYGLPSKSLVARYDFHPGTSQTQPEIGFSSGATERCRILYHAGSDNDFVAHSRSDGVSVVNTTFWSDVDPNKWYTLEIEKLESGTCRFWAYEKGAGRNPDQMTERTGLAVFNPEFWIMGDGGYFWVSNLYLGDVAESTTFLDDEGLEIQTHVELGHTRLASSTIYDDFGRAIKNLSPVPVAGNNYESQLETMADTYYQSFSEPGKTVFPYVETEYDFSGRPVVTYPAQLSANSNSRSKIATTYLMDARIPPAHLGGAIPADVVAVTDEDGRTSFSYTDIDGRTFLEFSEATIDAVPEIPATVADISASSNSEGSGLCSPICITSEVEKWDPAAIDTALFVPTKSFIGRAEASMTEDAHSYSVANIVKGNSHLAAFGHDGYFTVSTSQGDVPFFAGSTYRFRAEAFTSEFNGGFADSDLIVYGQENGKYRAIVDKYYQNYDFAGNLIESIEPNCMNSSQGGDCSGDWTRYFEYDNLNRMVASYSPDADGDGNGDPTNEVPGGAARPDYEYKYDYNGNLRFAAGPNGVNTSNPADQYFVYYDYDSLDRLVEVGTFLGLIEDANPNGPLQPGDKIREVSYSYFGNTLEYVVSQSDTTVYTYDALGNVSTLRQRIDGVGSKVTNYTYDKAGNIRSIAYQPGVNNEEFYLWYEYDLAGQLLAVKSNSVNDESTADVETSMAYSPLNQLSQSKLGANLQTVDYSYDLRSRLVQINDINSMGSGSGSDEFALSLGYDKVEQIAGLNGIQHEPLFGGNISCMAWRTKATEHQGKVAGYAFTYDHLNRLYTADFASRGESSESSWSQKSQFDVGLGQTAGIAYDDNGNILSLNRRKESTGDWNLAYSYESGSNQLNSVTISGGQNRTMVYDYNGNVTANSLFSSAVYDYANMPISMNVAGVGTFTYRYNSEGLRTVKDGPGSTDTEYYVRGLDGQVLAVYDDSGDVIYWNILAGRPIGRVNNNN